MKGSEKNPDLVPLHKLGNQHPPKKKNGEKPAKRGGIKAQESIYRHVREKKKIKDRTPSKGKLAKQSQEKKGGLKKEKSQTQKKNKGQSTFLKGVRLKTRKKEMKRGKAQ